MIERVGWSLSHLSRERERQFRSDIHVNQAPADRDLNFLPDIQCHHGKGGQHLQRDDGLSPRRRQNHQQLEMAAQLPIPVFESLKDIYPSDAGVLRER